MLKKFYIIFLVLQEIIAIKDAIPHLCCSHYPEKRKIGAKNPAGRKCSAVIIMSVFYPLETLGNGAKNGRQLDYTRLTDGIYPILWSKKRTRFLAIYY